jgi:hypothetical protein
MDQPEDYTRLGIAPGPVELWEDRRRTDPNSATEWEWWYFDSILGDGTKVVIQFLTTGQKSMVERTPTPSVKVEFTDPDGTTHAARPMFTAADAAYADDHCDVRFGPHRFAGDLRDFTIHLDEIDGLAADLHLTSLGRPYRPGTGYFGFGDDAHYYTWLCIVPRGEVTGTITVGGQTREVHGYGYHDHQWGNIAFWTLWNNWTWARQGFEDYSLLVFDMTASSAYGFDRFPLCFIQDKDGNLVFENTHGVAYETPETYLEPQSGKTYPKVAHYTFEHDGTTVDYTLTANREIDVADQYKTLPEQARAAFDKLGLAPSYARYAATGDLRITRGEQTTERSGELIYEYMFPGAVPFQEHN